ncbi:MAG: transcription termination/antitermination protein NusG [Rhodobacteraceae bacterium]|nr:transcription termination/antitermination protein NusG [Paracoccaceae bacterium]
MSVETVRRETSDDTGFKWYTVSVMTRHEKTVARQILDEAARVKLRDMFERIIVPTETVIEVRRGQKIPRERIFMPGYILVKMKMSDQTYRLVKDIRRVSGFLGGDDYASPLPESEVEVIINRTETGRTAPRALISFEVGDAVAVTDGPFEGWNGVVDEVDNDRRRVVIGVSIFGRMTQTEFSFDQITKEA